VVSTDKPRKEARLYSIKEAKEFLEALKTAPTVNEEIRILNKQAVVVNYLYDEIRGLLDRGYPLEAVGEILRSRNLDITTPTLKNYLQRAKDKDKEKEAKPKKKETKSRVATPSNVGAPKEKIVSNELAHSAIEQKIEVAQPVEIQKAESPNQVSTSKNKFAGRSTR